MASVLSDPRFHDEQAAYAWVEARIWPDGPICPHCGSVDDAAELKGKSTRIGVRKCRSCRKPFTVKVGTIFEASHVPMHIWFQAIALLTASRKGMSSSQLHRTLGVTLKTAWFMAHRIREAMRDGLLAPLGGEGKFIEADETFIGRKKGAETPGGGTRHKQTVMALVECGGSVRSFHVDGLTKKAVHEVLEHADRASSLMTDEARHYIRIGRSFAEHGRIDHRAKVHIDPNDRRIHTNTIEGYFGIFKRGMKGIHQHCGERHLHRCRAEFDFRYNARAALGVNDEARAEKAIRGITGKRLAYRTTDRQVG